MPRRAQPFASFGSVTAAVSTSPDVRLEVSPDASGAAPKAVPDTDPIPVATNSACSAELPHLVRDWLSDCEYRQHTAATIQARRTTLQKFLWFVRHRQYESVGTIELRQFFTYLARGHEEPGSRWENPNLTKPMRPVTVQTYHNHLRSFFSWLVEDGSLSTSPMKKIAPPTVRSDQIQPFSRDDIDALFQAVRVSYNLLWCCSRSTCVNYTSLLQVCKLFSFGRS